MKLSLSNRILKYLKARPLQRVAKGDFQRMVAAQTTYTPENVGRRLRELQEEGQIQVEYKKGHAFYWWEPRMMPVRQISAPSLFL